MVFLGSEVGRRASAQDGDTPGVDVFESLQAVQATGRMGPRRWEQQDEEGRGKR